MKVVQPAIARRSPLGEHCVSIPECQVVNSVYSRTLQRAALLSGGAKMLARRLRVPLSDLQKWIAGQGQPPTQVFLSAVDLVLDTTPRNALR